MTQSFGHKAKMYDQGDGQGEVAGMPRGPPSQRNQVCAQDGPYSSPGCMTGANRPFTVTSPSRYEDQWARDDAPWQENWPGKSEVDEGSEEEYDALSYYLSCFLFFFAK